MCATECDKSFTRSDALSKHMRTVHEPEPARGSVFVDPPHPKVRGSSKDKPPTNGSTLPNKKPPPQDLVGVPTHDEDGNPIDPSPISDNITYIPAHHPITGQPGFMIHYPPDIHFTAYESAINADHLMRVLRRQIAWASKEGEQLKVEVDELEKIKKEEWLRKEVLVEAVLEGELSNADRKGLLQRVDRQVEQAMEADTQPAKALPWKGEKPLWLRRKRNHDLQAPPPPMNGTPQEDDGEPSPPPTGASGGFEGEGDPYDNYLQGMMAQYEKKRQQSAQNTPTKGESEQQAAEADAVGALMGMSGGAQ